VNSPEVVVSEKMKKGHTERRAPSVLHRCLDYFFFVLFLAVVFFAAFVAFFCAIPGTPFTFGLPTADREPPKPCSGLSASPLTLITR